MPAEIPSFSSCPDDDCPKDGFSFSDLVPKQQRARLNTQDISEEIYAEKKLSPKLVQPEK